MQSCELKKNISLKTFVYTSNIILVVMQTRPRDRVEVHGIAAK